MTKTWNLGVLILALSCATPMKTQLNPHVRLEVFHYDSLPQLKNANITLGGFSGLHFEGKAQNGNLKFTTLTDRGPNGEPEIYKGKPPEDLDSLSISLFLLSSN